MGHRRAAGHARFGESRRWNEAIARQALDALKSSGLTLAEFARRESVDVQRLRRWRDRMTPREAGVEVPTFVEVKVAPPATMVEIVLLSGRLVRVPAAVDVNALRRLVAMLEEP
jgi:transposase-like protein